MTDPMSRLAVVRLEPDDRLVVLARTMQMPDSRTEAALTTSVANWARFGDQCLGQALYRHETVYRNASDAPVWSHVEFSYFRNAVPVVAIQNLVFDPQPAETVLLRAEILLTTPSSFVLPRDWAGSTDRPEWTVSLEYIDVHPSSLNDYRNVMRNFCGPAAEKLVGAGRFGTFRAMETAAVLYQDPGLNIDWNQIHLCELNPEGFKGFGPEFEAALRNDCPDGIDLAGTFASLDRMRTVPRWTFNEPLAELDDAVGRVGKATD